MEIHPKEIKGAWDQGYVLDIHTISSTLIGYNEQGHPEFDTVRSELGELVYRLKYKGDKSGLHHIAQVVLGFVHRWGIHPNVVIPVPPSRQRAFQPVIEIASEVAKRLGIALDTASLKKVKTTAQMKDIGDFQARVAALQSAFVSSQDVQDRSVLLMDDLFQSGATMNVAARTLKEQGMIRSVYAIALTRTRN